MNEKIIHHSKVVTALAEYYGKSISQNLLEMYVEDLLELSESELQRAAKMFRRDAKNVFFPTPAALVALARPLQTPEDAAREASARILECLSVDGHTNPERACNRMGELAWEVVKRMGGWSRVCQETTYQNTGTFAAQCRELAATLHRKALNGIPLSEVPALPARNEYRENSVALSEVVQKITSGIVA